MSCGPYNKEGLDMFRLFLFSFGGLVSLLLLLLLLVQRIDDGESACSGIVFSNLE